MEIRNGGCKCGCTTGYIVTKGGQDVLYCDACNNFQYNAPKTETGREVRSLETIHKSITPSVRNKVILRANGKCELCGSIDNIEIGHVISVKLGFENGFTDQEINSENNLAAMCKKCNLGLRDDILPLKNIIFMITRRIKPE